jgi:hypothetical protein
MFFLRLNGIKIVDNGSVKSGLGLFGHDFSTVKLISLVTTDNTDLPNLDRLISEPNADERQKILQSSVESVVASRVFTQIERVTDHATIAFGDTGLVVYQAEKIPESVNWLLLAVKSRQQMRNNAQTVHDVLTHKDFGLLENSIIALLKGGAAVANPAVAAGLQIAKFVGEVTAAALMQSGDKQLGIVTMSLGRAEHYPAGLRDSKDVIDATRNMTFDYSIFAYERALPVEQGAK